MELHHSSSIDLSGIWNIEQVHFQFEVTQAMIVDNNDKPKGVITKEKKPGRREALKQQHIYWKTHPTRHMKMCYNMTTNTHALMFHGDFS